VRLTVIGRIRSGYGEQRGTPIQPRFGEAGARVEIEAPWRAALADLAGFARIWLVTWLDRAGPARPTVVPYRDTVERGLFATRAPTRPNPIGLSCVTVRSVDVSAGVIETGPVDLLDGTPVLDVKPYVPEFDAFPDAAAGWLDGPGSGRDRADGRFEEPGEAAP
jgi:tRNA-Thr(GGU) m(6)t(6)A37 methyltransferase TsaA